MFVRLSWPTRCSSALLVLYAASAGAADHYWIKRGGTLASSSYTSATIASSIEEPPSWTWKNDLDEQIRFTPLIDAERNIYIQSVMRVLKFNPDGALLWTWEVNRSIDGKINTAPVLYEDQILLATSGPKQCSNGALHAVSTLTGQPVWRLPVTRCLTHEANSLFAENNVIVLGARNLERLPTLEEIDGGANTVLGFQISSKEELWTYDTDDLLWNFMPSSVGDGTIIFATSCGGVHRINLHTGELLWKAGRLGDTKGASRMCGAGSGALGPNGKFYAEYSDNFNDTSSLPRTERAKLAAFEVSDGRRLWERAFSVRPEKAITSAEEAKTHHPMEHRSFWEELSGWQAPGVGLIDGRTVVVAAVGGVTGKPPWPGDLPVPDLVKAGLYFTQQHVSWFRRHVFGAPSLRNEVVAVDGESGAVLWRYAMPIWDHYGPRNDEANFITRAIRQAEDPFAEVLCWPDNQGIPTIDGDGTVYATDGNGGGLYAIRDKNKDGVIEENEVQHFVTNIEFLNGPSIAPGLLVAAPCWGDVYVWKE